MRGPNVSELRSAGAPAMALGRAAPGRCSATAMVAEVVSGLGGPQGLSDQTVRRLVEVMARFLAFIDRGWGVRDVRDVEAYQVREFVLAPLAVVEGVRAPSVATAHLRRSALRLMFRALR